MAKISELERIVVNFLRREKQRYAKAIGPVSGGLLAEHSIRVAHIARQIAREIGGDPEVAYVAGLLHDIGKFKRKLDNKKAIEEHLSIRIAEDLLSDFSFSADFIEKVTTAILGLAKRIPETRESAALYDADILDKSGAHGLVNIIAKYVALGETLADIVEKRFSGEMTYLANLDKILTTTAARKMAPQFKTLGLTFANSIIDELCTMGFLFRRYKLEIKNVNTILIKRDTCPICGDLTKFTYHVRMDVVDEIVEFTVFCECGWKVSFGFCIPKIFEKPIF